MSWFGYARASMQKQEMSPETQHRIIQEYVARFKVQDLQVFVDPAAYSKKSLWDRVAGRELMKVLKRGDNVVVVRLDRLARSLLNFSKILDSWQKQGISLHITDFAGGVFDPENPMSRLMAHVLMSFAEFERDMISQRTKEGLATRRANNLRASYYAPWGFKLVQRGWNHRRGKPDHVVVPNEEEQEMMRRIVELRARGYSYSQLMNYFNDEWKKYNRCGSRWNIQGMRDFLAKSARFIKNQVDSDQQADEPVELDPEPEEEGSNVDEIFGTRR